MMGDTSTPSESPSLALGRLFEVEELRWRLIPARTYRADHGGAATLGGAMHVPHSQDRPEILCVRPRVPLPGFWRKWVDTHRLTTSSSSSSSGHHPGARVVAATSKQR